MKKKILISSGGSGGHVIPAMAFYDHLKENFDVFILIDKRGSKFLNKKKYNYKIIDSPKLNFNFFNFPLVLIKLLFSFLVSFFFLKKNKVDILLGTGGYMSVPICLAAKILSIKIYLFEPNMVIGRANKFLLKFSKKIFCYSNEIKNFSDQYKNKIFVIDKILRKEIYSFGNIKHESINENINLIILGGSQGAKFFDQNLKNSLIKLSKKYKLKIYHQIGVSDLKDLELFYKEKEIESIFFNFEENIFKYMSKANLAITRAGASTLSELVFLKVPIIAIPYKFATDNHQLQNAIYYEKNDCCWILNEEEFTNDKLTTLLLNIVQNKEDYLKKKNSLEKFSYQNNWNNINKKLKNCLDEN
tara:strand:+ start:610 stop:1686 length:1077 start_codon:yes stop_codon:yes gene_type:complete